MDAYNYNWMARFRFCLPFLFFGGWVTTPMVAANTQAKDPEAVYVAVEQARLFAGPSTDFYPTGAAVRGAVLEVYHRPGNGWLAIRPPQGSFSWVPASQAYMLPGGRVIEITDASAVSWIGTELGSAKQYRWQVQLNVGEQLSVLGEATVKNGSDEREALWYKVAPPAGEFRWIEEAAVAKTPPVTKNAQAKDSQVAATDNSDDSTANSEVVAASGAANASSTGKSAIQAAVKSASAEGAPEQSTAPNTAQRARPAQPTPKLNKHPQTKTGSEWDGWYAFEMSEQGVKTPFLDKLSGRDRGKGSPVAKGSSSNHDPLIQDPFSLTMAGEQASNRQPPKTSPQEMVEAARKQKEWRDPRALREARLAGHLPTRQPKSLETIVDRFDRAMESVSGVLPASDEQSVPAMSSFAADQGVSTAGFEDVVRATSPDTTSASSASVNWYGLTETKPNGMLGASASANRSSNLGAGSGGPTIVTSTADVAELQVALNNAVASSNGPWNLTPLAEHARYLIEHGPTAIDRGQARLLLERINEFQNISVRSQQLAGPQFPGQPAVQQPYQTARQISVQTESNSNSVTPGNSLPTSSFPTNHAAHYDATGWLVPVHAAGPDQPTHALTNDTGDVLAYVSPIAGLNLDRYRNQAVGITGLRGYLPQLQAAHIQAQRVSRIR